MKKPYFELEPGICLDVGWWNLEFYCPELVLGDALPALINAKDESINTVPECIDMENDGTNDEKECIRDVYEGTDAELESTTVKNEGTRGGMRQKNGRLDPRSIRNYNPRQMLRTNQGAIPRLLAIICLGGIFSMLII